MIAPNFEEVHSEEWIQTHLPDRANELVLFRQIIPWEQSIVRLTQFYDSRKGAMGKSLRMMVAILLLAKLRDLSDRQVIASIQENPYMQYFCNVPSAKLKTFLHSSSLCVFRKRLGVKGAHLIEAMEFAHLRRAGALKNDAALIDSSVLENNLIYPNDVRLLFRAFHKMKLWAIHAQKPYWWNHKEIKQLWRE